MIENNDILEVDFTSGFFSTCYILLHHIMVYHQNTKKLPTLNNFKLWNTYKDENVDISHRFFKNEQTLKEIEPEYFSTANCEHQFSDYSLINYNYSNKIIDNYYSPSDEILTIKDTILNKYNIDLTKTISICYRGLDKKRETNLPTHEEMLEKLTQVKNLYPNHKILVQSDEIEFCEFILSKFPDSIVIEETKKINWSEYQGAIQYTIPGGERVVSAQNFLAVMYILSKSDVVILNSGNVGLWICLFRGSYNNVYQYLNPFIGENVGWIK